MPNTKSYFFADFCLIVSFLLNTSRDGLVFVVHWVRAKEFDKIGISEPIWFPACHCFVSPDNNNDNNDNNNYNNNNNNLTYTVTAGASNPSVSRKDVTTRTFLSRYLCKDGKPKICRKSPRSNSCRISFRFL